MIFRRLALLLSLFMAAGVSAPAWAGTCSLCRETLESGGAGLIRGFYLSIVLIVTLPLIFLFFLARYAWRAYQPAPRP